MGQQALLSMEFLHFMSGYKWRLDIAMYLICSRLKKKVGSYISGKGIGCMQELIAFYFLRCLVFDKGSFIAVQISNACRCYY